MVSLSFQLFHSSGIRPMSFFSKLIVGIETYNNYLNRRHKIPLHRRKCQIKDLTGWSLKLHLKKRHPIPSDDARKNYLKILIKLSFSRLFKEKS